MKNIIYIFIGGGTGSVLRYLIQLFINQNIICRFPLGTFIVNILGCFLIGIFYTLSEQLNLSDETRLMLTVGLCGGFTTFSTFSTENLNLLQNELYGICFLYFILSISLCILSTFYGIYLTRNLL